MIELHKTVLSEKLGGSDKENRQKKANLRKQLEGINERINKMQDLLLDGTLDAEDYSSMKARYTAQIKEINGKMKFLGGEISKIKGLIESSLLLLSNLPKLFTGADAQAKQKIVGSIFNGKVSFDGKICRTPQLNPVVALFANVNEGLPKKAKGLNEVIFIQSQSAEREGFEPSVLVRVHTLSRRAISATHAPLHFAFGGALKYKIIIEQIATP